MSLNFRSHCTVTRLLITIIISLILLSLSAATFAATESAVLFTLSQKRNMSITVHYDKEIPVITFISPNGEKYNEGAVSEEKMTVRHTKGGINYLIPNAAPGDWHIEYDKLSNDVLEVNYVPYAEGIIIESFKLGDVSEHTASVDFEVSYTDESVYQYVIYAAITDENSNVTGQRELASGSASAGRSVTTEVPLSPLSSYDKYHLMLEVYLESAGIEVFDTAVTAGAFSYTNSSTPAPLSDFYAELDLTDESLLIDWTDYAVSSCEEYIIAVYMPNDLHEPMYSSSFDPGITNTSLAIDSSVEFIRVELSYRKNGVISEIMQKDILINNGTTITIASQAQTSSVQAVIEYKTGKPIHATVCVNERSDEILLDGSGQFSITLDEFSNDIQVSYSPETNVCFIISNEIFSDRIAPVLLLYENRSTVTTIESSYTLAGETEPGCTLTINGEAVTLNEDGTFLHELNLSNGSNEFTISSTDAAGNSSMQKINIQKGSVAETLATGKDSSLLKRYLPLILTLIASIVIIVCVLLFSRAYTKHAPGGRFKAVIMVLRNSFAVISSVMLIVLAYLGLRRQMASRIINTPKYLDIVKKSVQDAYQAMLEFEKYNRLFVTYCYVAGFCIAFTILFGLVLYFVKKNKNKGNNGDT